MTILRLIRTVGVIGVCLLVLLSLVPGAYRPHTGASGNLEHFLAYGLTSAALALEWRSPFHILTIVLALFVLAFGLEMVQLFVSGRSVNWMTAFVSGFGGICGVLSGAGLLWAAELQRAAAAAPTGGTVGAKHAPCEWGNGHSR